MTWNISTKPDGEDWIARAYSRDLSLPPVTGRGVSRENALRDLMYKMRRMTDDYNDGDRMARTKLEREKYGDEGP